MNSNQPIFDAITAATRIENDYGGQSTQATIIDVQKFIETFNNHRDRKLCIALTPLPDGEAVAWRWREKGFDPWKFSTNEPDRSKLTWSTVVEPLYASPPPVSGDVRWPDRETIAKIIEDNVYRKHNGNWDGDFQDLLVAADAIRALSPSGEKRK